MNIYKIINNVNDMVYIGQTLKPLKDRFMWHIYESRRSRAKNRPLYQAFNIIGVDNFSIELIEVCDDELGDDRERYWIDRYNSYFHGYNCTYGGKGKPQIDYDCVIKKYEELENMAEVARILDIDAASVKKILVKNDIDIKPATNVLKKYWGKRVAQFDKNHNFLNNFDSIEEAFRWLKDNHIILPDANRGMTAHISQVCKGERKSAFGYLWAYCD